MDHLIPLQPPGDRSPYLRLSKPLTTVAVRPSAGSGGARNDPDGRPAGTGAGARPLRIEPLPGPEPPTGPPPAFAANILEVEEKRRRDGPDLLADAKPGHGRLRDMERAAGHDAPPPQVDLKL
jgi:hypothetical protein